MAKSEQRDVAEKPWSVSTEMSVPRCNFTTALMVSEFAVLRLDAFIPLAHELPSEMEDVASCFICWRAMRLMASSFCPEALAHKANVIKVVIIFFIVFSISNKYVKDDFCRKVNILFCLFGGIIVLLWVIIFNCSCILSDFGDKLLGTFLKK